MPGWPGTPTIVTVAVAAFAIVPREQVTVPAASEQVPCVEFAERYVTTEGNGSETYTLVAEFGPLLVTVNVYVSSVPSVTGFGEADFTMATSALFALATTRVAV